MAPVAGGISNTEQNRPVQAFRCLKGFVSPWIPVDRVVGMLKTRKTSRYRLINHGIDLPLLLPDIGMKPFDGIGEPAAIRHFKPDMIIVHDKQGTDSALFLEKNVGCSAFPEDTEPSAQQGISLIR